MKAKGSTKPKTYRLVLELDKDELDALEAMVGKTSPSSINLSNKTSCPWSWHAKYGSNEGRDFRTFTDPLKKAIAQARGI